MLVLGPRASRPHLLLEGQAERPRSQEGRGEGWINLPDIDRSRQSSVDVPAGAAPPHIAGEREGWASLSCSAGELGPQARAAWGRFATLVRRATLAIYYGVPVHVG